MLFPLGFYDVSLLLAVTSITLLATSELLSLYHGQTDLIIKKSRLRKVALILGVLFSSTVAIRIYQIIITL